MHAYKGQNVLPMQRQVQYWTCFAFDSVNLTCNRSRAQALVHSALLSVSVRCSFMTARTLYQGTQLLAALRSRRAHLEHELGLACDSLSKLVWSAAQPEAVQQRSFATRTKGAGDPAVCPVGAPPHFRPHAIL